MASVEKIKARQQGRTDRTKAKADRDKAGFAAGFNVTGDRSAAIASGVSSIAQAAVAVAGAASGAGAAVAMKGKGSNSVASAAVESANQLNPQLSLPNIQLEVDTVPFYQKPWFLITVVLGVLAGVLAFAFGGRKRKK